MSATEMCTFGADGRVAGWHHFKNAWGGAMAVWDELAKQYISGAGLMGLSPEAMRGVWALADDPRLKWFERIVLLTTFDRCLVLGGDLAACAKAFELFDARYGPARRARGVAFNIGDQATALAGAAAAGARAVGWNQTSVNGDCEWYGEWDEESDKEVPYDLNTGTAHWFIEFPQEAVS